MEDEFVTLTSYRFGPKAELAKSCLEAAGIRAFVNDVGVALGNVAGYNALSVPREQAEQAAAILREHPELLDANQPESSGEDQEHDACLACGEPMDDDADVCAKCGWSYDDLDEDGEEEEEEA
jgi:hypothetical protein